MTVTTPVGRLLRDEQGLRLEFVRSYDAPTTQVWAALTEPDHVERWFGRWTGDPATGSVQVVMTAENDAPAETVHVLRCEPPTALVVELPSPDGAWRLELSLAGRGTGTELRFRQRLAEPYDATSIGPGWHFYLDRMEAVLHGTDVPEDFDAYVPGLQSRYVLPG